MEIVTSYTVTVLEQLSVSGKGKKRMFTGADRVDDRLMRQTAGFCLGALKMCADIYLKEWDSLSSLPSSLLRRRAGDLLVHSTDNNRAPYPQFDELYGYMPAYTRRSVVADAMGMVSSYMSNLADWKEKKPAERGAQPTLGLPDRYEPAFYSQERDLCSLEKGIIGLKLYDGKAWDWHYFRVNASDARYIARLRGKREMLSPVVEKVKGRYRIRFAFRQKQELVQADDPLSYTILAVDLGINAPASWCVMDCGGTVHAKGVIHLPCDEDRLRHAVNRKRMYQREGKKPSSACRFVTNANRKLSVDTCREVMRTAVLYDVDCIVFEHLDRAGKVKGRRYRERIHLWRAKDVQKRVGLQAHQCGMRISRVCAWGTSRYAFNGSGEVSRGKDAGLSTYSVCRFPDGKVYNCDLSAAQNIGARYFLREYAKKEGCPEMPKTPQRTYSTLLGVAAAFAKKQETAAA